MYLVSLVIYDKILVAKNQSSFRDMLYPTGSVLAVCPYLSVQSVTSLYLYGIVCLIVYYLLSLLIVLNQDEISFGLCTTSYMIIEPVSLLPEVKV